MSAISTSNVQLGTRSADVIETCDIYLGYPWAEKSNGAITVTAEGGVNVAGLTIGQYYCIEGRGGPWTASPTITNQYDYALSNDGGTTWSATAGYSGFSDVYSLGLPAWGIRAERADDLRARTFWKATTTSIDIRVADAPGAFADNGGSFSYKLSDWLDVAIRTIGVRLN